MAAAPDKVDLEARIRAARVIHEKFRRVLEDIMEGKPPKLVIPKRTLANTVFDPERGILVLGSETLEREFLDMGEARRFMQTVLMASIIYQALIENEYPTIRDLYYRGKHTIVYRDLRGRLREENTWDEQAESDAVIRDIEVYTGMLREDMLILSKEKGKVVGNMRIRSGGDVIDLSRLGHGAYAIESTPDLIEFLDWDAEFVLVVEKDAVFQQLHRVGFWKKYKAILVTGAGQPDRATRRFVRRLNEELGLPVYVLTDSIPGDEVVMLEGPGGLVEAGPIEDLLSGSFTGGDRERAVVDARVPAWDPETGLVRWAGLGYAYRHWVEGGELVEIETRGRGVVRATGGHSLYVLRDGRLRLVTAGEVEPGDYLVVAERIPPAGPGLDPAAVVSMMVSRCPARIPVSDGRLCYSCISLAGLATASAVVERGRYVRASLGRASPDRVEEYMDIIRRCGARGFVEERRGRTVIVVADKRCVDAVGALGIGEVDRRRVPAAVMSGGAIAKLAFLRGVYEGSGYIDRSGEVVLKLRGEAYAKQVFLMLQTLGVNPSVGGSGERVEVRISPSRRRTPPEVYRAITGEDPPPAGEGPDPLYSIPVPEEARRELALLHGSVLYINRSARRLAKWKLRRAMALAPSLRAIEPIVLGGAVVVAVSGVRRRRYSGYVYDLAVPGVNTFTGSYGVVYHNSDPYGWYIYSVFKVGSIQLSYESERLATPKARFLGVSMTDVFGYGRKKPYLTEAERRNYIIKAKETDIRRAKELMNYSWFRTKGWMREIRIFLNKKAKLEIEALASKGLKFLAFKYLPEKIETGDWIE